MILRYSWNFRKTEKRTKTKFNSWLNSTKPPGRCPKIVGFVPKILSFVHINITTCLLTMREKSSSFELKIFIGWFLKLPQRVVIIKKSQGHSFWDDFQGPLLNSITNKSMWKHKSYEYRYHIFFFLFWYKSQGHPSYLGWFSRTNVNSITNKSTWKRNYIFFFLL